MRNLDVDPMHLRDLRLKTAQVEEAQLPPGINGTWPSSDRSRRIRDAVEAALSDIILLGTEDQVRLAARAATELAEGRAVQTAELVVSLRNFIRQVLDLDPVPAGLTIPKQGPARPGATRSAGKADGGGAGGDKQGGSGKGGTGDAMLGAGMGAGVGMGVSGEPREDTEDARD